MLEKIGLPPKPSARGSAWVIDASHCQSCCSQFSLFNRKHHCRRCGGLFCGNCVQSRMYLRGQGDAPVRICEPCKKIEEAARFESRYGHRNKKKAEDTDSVLRSLLNDGSESSSPGTSTESLNSTPLSPEKLRERAQEEKKNYATLKKEGKFEEATKAFKRSRELERQADALVLSMRKSSRLAAKASSAQAEQPTAESLPHEKKDNKVSGEKDDLMSALRELGWNEADVDDTGKQDSDAAILGLDDEPGVQKVQRPVGSDKTGPLQMEILGHKRKALALKREGKLTEAKEELKKAKVLEKKLEELETLGEAAEVEDEEDEIAILMRSFEKEAGLNSGASTNEVALNADGLPSMDDDANVDVSDTDMTDPEMIAALKGMGWQEEAATLQSFNDPLKISTTPEEGLRTQILSHKRKALDLKRLGNLEGAKEELRQAKSLEQTLQQSDDTFEVSEAHLDVTDQDMRDPEMITALQALGFGDADTTPALTADLSAKHTDKRALQQELLAIKRSILALKRQGDAAGASAQLERAKVVEDKLRSQEAQETKPVFQHQLKTAGRVEVVSSGDEEDASSGEEDTELAAILKGLSLGDAEEELEETPNVTRPKRRTVPTVPKPEKSKRELQGEILGIKRKALALRRAGKIDEAEKELEQVKVLEIQLRMLEAPEAPEEEVGDDDGDGDEGIDAEVTEKDMSDPGMLAALSKLGFKDVDPKSEKCAEDKDFEGEYGEIGMFVDIAPPVFSGMVPTSQEQSATDFLTGDDWKPSSEQPPEVLKEEKLVKPKAISDDSVRSVSKAAVKLEENRLGPEHRQVKGDQLLGAAVELPQVELELKQQVRRPQSQGSSGETEQLSLGAASLSQEILAHKRRALALKREGDLVSAREELRKAKLLEKKLETTGSTETVEKVSMATRTSPVQVEAVREQAQPSRARPQGVPKDRMKLQQQSLGHKRRAMALRREGKVDEAEAEYEKAKELEKQMEELDPAPSESGSVEMDPMEDVFDPQLMAALANIGLMSDTPVVAQKVTSTKTAAPRNSAEMSRAEKVKALKLRAVELKRAGNRQGALEALQEAKRLEMSS